MRTRTSPRNQDRLFRELFQPEKIIIEPRRPAHLDMSDQEIDRAYWSTSKTSRGQMKREAAKERLRAQVRAHLNAAGQNNTQNPSS